jgi:hypothetical protein
MAAFAGRGAHRQETSDGAAAARLNHAAAAGWDFVTVATKGK